MGNIATQILITAKEELDEKIKSANELLKNNELLSKNDITRKFKPNLLTYLWTQNTKDENGYRTISIDKSKIDTDLQQIKNRGIDGIEICLHIDFNETTRKLYYYTNLDTIDYVIQQCRKLDLKTPIIKLHQKFNLDQIKYLFANTKTKEENLYDITTQTNSIAEFKNEYTFIVKKLCTKYKEYIQYISCFNEFQHFWDRDIIEQTQDTSATDKTQIPNPLYTANMIKYVNSTITLVQNYGLKSGVSVSGVKDINNNNKTSMWSALDTVDSTILNNSSVLFINLYPSIGDKGSATTLEDCITAISNNVFHQKIKQIKEKYSNKEIFITETGCMDLWDSLFNCGYYGWTGETQNGKVQGMYLEALLEVFSKYTKDDISNIAWWYTDCFTTNSNVVKPIVSKYLGKGV